MDGLMTFCHDARKGRHSGSHWSKPVAPPLHSMFLGATLWRRAGAKRRKSAWLSKWISRPAPCPLIGKCSRGCILKGDFSNPTLAPSVRSNVTTILGRTAAYQPGQEVTWKQILDAAEKWEFDSKGLKA